MMGALIIPILIAITLLGTMVFPITKEVLATLNNVENIISSVDFHLILTNEWSTINGENIDNVFARENTTETHKSNNDNFDVTVNYGEKTVISTAENGDLDKLPITITITNLEKGTSYSKSSNVYRDSLGEKNLIYNNNYPTNQLSLKYDTASELMKFFVDGNLITKESAMFESGNGYIKFSNGLIMQWGMRKNIYFDESHFERFNFPIPFPHACLNVITSTVRHTDKTITSYVHDYHPTYFNELPGYTWGGKGYGDTYWTAIGY